MPCTPWVWVWVRKGGRAGPPACGVYTTQRSRPEPCLSACLPEGFAILPPWRLPSLAPSLPPPSLETLTSALSVSMWMVPMVTTCGGGGGVRPGAVQSQGQGMHARRTAYYQPQRRRSGVCVPAWPRTRCAARRDWSGGRYRSRLRARGSGRDARRCQRKASWKRRWQAWPHTYGRGESAWWRMHECGARLQRWLHTQPRLRTQQRHRRVTRCTALHCTARCAAPPPPADLHGAPERQLLGRAKHLQGGVQGGFSYHV